MYEKFYGLTADPFRLSPDYRFCFEHRSYAKAKAYMEYALHRAEGFVLITGKPGTGKTTLINDVIEAVRNADMVIATLVSTQLEANDLLRMVAFSFGIDAEVPSKATVLLRVMSFFERKHEEGSRVLLVIDEAQDLAPAALEELRLLTNLQRHHQPLLQIFLLGQESLRDLVRDPCMEQVQQRLVAAWTLEPLGPKETMAYVRHRLDRVGWRNDPVIDEDVFTYVYQFSRGVPRRINLICSRLLLHGFVEESHRITRTDAATVFSELGQEDLFPAHLGSASVVALGDSEPELDREAPAAKPRCDTEGWQGHQGVESHERERTAEETPGPLIHSEAPPAPLVGESAVRDPVPAEEREQTKRKGDPESAGQGEEDGLAKRVIDDALGSARRPRSLRAGYLVLGVFALAASLWIIRAALIDGQIAEVEKWMLSRGDQTPDTRHPLGESEEQRRSDLARASPAGEPMGLADHRPQNASDYPTRQLAGKPRETVFQPLEKPVAAGAVNDLDAEPKGADRVAEAHASRVAEAASRAENEDASSALRTAAVDLSQDRAVSGEAAVDQSPGGSDLEATPGGFAGVDQPHATVSADAEAGGDAPGRGEGEAPAPADIETDVAGASEKQVSLEPAAPARPLHQTGGERSASRPDDRGKTGWSEQVLFAIDSTKIRPRYQQKLDQIAAMLRRSKVSSVEIVGYADRLGPSEYNLDLSRRRADAVANYLAGKGVSADRLRSEGRGPRGPEHLGEDRLQQANWQDRMVEVSVVLE